jgi:hypothetical protein
METDDVLFGLKKKLGWMKKWIVGKKNHKT